MIIFDHTEVVGWEHAIRGMRNPMESWDRSDSSFCSMDAVGECKNQKELLLCEDCSVRDFTMGPKDMELMMKLWNSGPDHRKFLRMIVVYVDILAPLYWWKEFDTYKVGTVANSCSTMHCIHKKEFEFSDFSFDHFIGVDIWDGDDEEKATESPWLSHMARTVNLLNAARECFLNAEDPVEKKKCWWQMIQLLPTSYNQKRTVMMSYEVLANIYKSRQNHKLDEWAIGFMNWLKALPYSELITGGK